LYDKETKVRKPTQIYLGYITENSLVRVDDATCTEYGYSKIMLLKGSSILLEMKNQYGDELGTNLFKQLVRRYSERSYLTETMENLDQIDNRYIASFEALHDRLSYENPKLYLLKWVQHVKVGERTYITNLTEEEEDIILSYGITIKMFRDLKN
jgi:hypothetical protein